METQKVRINPKNGRVTFTHTALFPQGRWTEVYYQNYRKHYSHLRTYAIGFDILYCAETSELAFEIYRHEFKSTEPDERKKELADIGATLWLKKDCSINIHRYFDEIPELKKLRQHLVERPILFDAKMFESRITVKLDALSNRKTATRSQFKKIQLKRIKNARHEILLDPAGYLRLPRDTLQMGKRVKVDIDNQQVTLTFGSEGERAIKKDATLNIKTLLRDYGIKITQKLYMPYLIKNDRIVFNLNGSDPKLELQAFRSITRALGIFE